MPTRTGTCNRCGQCCGAEGSPNQHTPWPRHWMRGKRNWAIGDVLLNRPLLEYIQSPYHGGASSGAILIGGNTIRWIWIEGGLYKDLPPYGDPSSYSEECPLLLDDPGDGTRPCALVGTPYESIWETMCQSAPPEEKTEEEVAQWQADHPLCSYTWV